MVSKLDYVPNLPWDIPGWIWDMITFGTSIYPKSEVRFGMYEIRIPVWDIPKLIWDIGSVWATTTINKPFYVGQFLRNDRHTCSHETLYILHKHKCNKRNNLHDL